MWRHSGFSLWRVARTPIPGRCWRNMKRTEATTENRIKVYTKTGDKGASSLFNGERRTKADQIFSALGDTDETNSHIGMALSTLPQELQMEEEICLREWLPAIQSRLLDIGSAIATPDNEFSSQARIQRVEFDEKHVQDLESWIDTMDAKLPPLKNFILPGGGQCASSLHIARSVCRRAERSVVPLEGSIPGVVQRYLNRLSDFLFVSARLVAAKSGNPDTIYKKSK